MRVRSATFVRSAVGSADLPRDPVPQVALVGRSNVGKSTLVNALTRSRVARTSAAPGKTRQINLYAVEIDGFTPGRLYLADLPGYGYARGGEASAEEFDRLAREYFSQPAAGATITKGQGYGPSAALLVVDSRHPGLHADIMAHLWLKNRNLPLAIVASKIDKLNRAERTRALSAWAKAVNAEVIPVAAATGDGLTEVWKAIGRLLTPRPQEEPSPPNPNPSRSPSPSPNLNPSREVEEVDSDPPAQ